MQLLRVFFGLNGLYSVKKRGRYCMEAVYWALAIFFLLGGIQELDGSGNLSVAVWPLLAVLAVYYTRCIVQTLHFNRIVRQHKTTAPYDDGLNKWYTNTAVLQQYYVDTRSGNVHFTHLHRQEYWQLYDITIDKLGHAKFGTYLATQTMHTVFESTLQRIVPNVVFDNKQAHGRQFKANYLSSQRLSFEGNFDTYFDSYGPQGYHVDTFSFISPEVLHAMVDFEIACDVEIVDNRLVCYAPALPLDKLEAFRKQCVNLYAHLNNNLDTYRDDRLTGTDRVRSTTPFARQLLINPLRHWIFLTIFGLGTLALIVASILLRSSEVILNQASAYIWGPFVGGLAQAGNIWRKNHREIKRFERLLAYSRTDDPRKPKQPNAQP